MNLFNRKLTVERAAKGAVSACNNLCTDDLLHRAQVDLLSVRYHAPKYPEKRIADAIMYCMAYLKAHGFNPETEIKAALNRADKELPW